MYDLGKLLDLSGAQFSHQEPGTLRAAERMGEGHPREQVGCGTHLHRGKPETVEQMQSPSKTHLAAAAGVAAWPGCLPLRAESCEQGLGTCTQAIAAPVLP